MAPRDSRTPVPLIAGSYVTHETKHFIYFYLGEPTLRTSQWRSLSSWRRIIKDSSIYLPHPQAKSPSFFSSLVKNVTGDSGLLGKSGGDTSRLGTARCRMRSVEMAASWPPSVSRHLQG